MRHHSTAAVFTDQCGSVLIGGMILVLAVTLIGAGLFQAAVIENRLIVFTENEVKARYAAESGLNRAAADVAWPEIRTTLFGVNSTFDGIKGLLNADNTTPSALYATTCFGTTRTCTEDMNPQKAAYLVQAVNHPDADKFWLVSTACLPGPAEVSCPSNRRAAAEVRALIRKPVTGVGFPGSYFAGSTSCTSAEPCVNIKGNSETYSYNTRKPGCYTPGDVCDYDPSTNSGNNGDILSNGSISVSGTFRGDVIGYQDVGGRPDVKASGTVYGTIQSGGVAVGTNVNGDPPVSNSSIAPKILPPEPNCGPPYTTLTPVVRDALGNVVSGNVEVTGGPTLGNVYNSSTGVLEFNSGTVTLQPGIYCFSTVHVSTNGATLNVTGTAVTGIFVDGQIYLQSGAQINNAGQDPEKLQFISTYGNDAGETGFGQCGGAGVCLDAGGTTMYMTLYAPTTKVKLQGDGKLYGAIAANTIEASPFDVYYDEYLGSGLATILRGVPLDGAANTPANYAVLNWQQPFCKKALLSDSWSCS